MENEVVPPLVVDETSIQQSASGSVTGVIFWQIADGSFPDNSWSDFAIVLLTWWVQAISKLSKDERGDAILYYMDGPLEIDLRRHQDTICFNFIRRARTKQTLFSARCSYNAFLGQFIKTVEAVINICKNKNLHSGEIDDLSQAMFSLYPQN